MEIKNGVLTCGNRQFRFLNFVSENDAFKKNMYMSTELINNEERKHGLIIIVYLGYNNHKSLARKFKENEVNK